MSKAKVANPYAKGSAFLSTKAALAAAGIRCNRNNGGDAKCGARTTPPADASAVCLAARCTFRESSGARRHNLAHILTSSLQVATLASPPGELMEPPALPLPRPATVS